MYFLIDKKKKIIIGWSAKCGCSHIKKIFHFLTDMNVKNIHTRSYNALPNNVSDYTIIIISRNPYKRLVSGFLDKYNIVNGQFINKWKHTKMTFVMFVNELLKNEFKMIDRHHFTPQTSEVFDINKINSAKLIKIFDIEDIDYTFIENLYNKKITNEIKTFKGPHSRTKIINNKYNEINNYVYNLDMIDYINSKVDYKYFYNYELKDKVNKFFKNDFDFFGIFNYDI